MSSLEDFAETQIRDLMRKDIEVYTPDERASEVLGGLKENNHYEAFIKGTGKVGLATVRHLLEVTQPQQTRIGDYPKDLWGIYPGIPPTSTVLDVTEVIIGNWVRALPVVEDGDPVGIISQVEVLQGLEGIPEMRNIRAIDVMTQPVITMREGDNVASARSKMLKQVFSHIPVVNEENRLVGMVTAKELVYKFIKPAGSVTVGERGGRRVSRFEGELGQVMDTSTVTVDEEATAADVVELMNERNSSYCIVNDHNGFVAGIITPRELLRPLLRFIEEEELPVYIVGLTAEEDWFNTAVAEDKIRRVVRRAQGMHPHLREVRVKIEKQRAGGNRTRYETKAHVYTKATGETIHVQEEGWDLLQVFDNLTDALDKILRDKKHKPRRINRYKPLNKRGGRRRRG